MATFKTTFPDYTAKLQYILLIGASKVNDRIITRGESGRDARPIIPKWVTDIRDQCVRAKVPFFFKQWGGIQKKKAGRTLEGRTWDEMPLRMHLVKA